MRVSSTAEWKTTKINPQLHAVLKVEAARMGISITDLVEVILSDYLRRQGTAIPEPRATRATQDLFLVGNAASGIQTD